MVVCARRESVNGVAMITEAQVQKALERLDREIQKREVYKTLREVRIDSVKMLRLNEHKGSDQWFDHTMEIAKGYNSFNNDSALVYYTQGFDCAVEQNLDSVANAFRVNRATYLSISGYIQDALHEIEAIDTVGMSDGQRRIYSMQRAGFFLSFLVITKDFFLHRIIGTIAPLRRRAICCLCLRKARLNID